MRSLKLHWVVGFKQKQYLSEEIFRNNVRIQTYNWTKYALCESTVIGGLQAAARASRRSFSKPYSHSNNQLNKICALWKYTDCWDSSRSNGSHKKFFKTLNTFKHTIDQVCALWKYTDWWVSIRSNCFRKKFFKTLYTFKHTIEQSMRSVKVQWVVGFKQKQGLPGEIFKNIIHIQSYNWKKCALCQSNKVTWVVGFKQKQWLSEEVFWNIIHMQTYNWTKYALCESTPSGGLQAEAIAFRRSFSKHYTHSNIQLNKKCALWKYTDCWDSSRSNGSHKKLFKTLYTFQHKIDQSMRSVKVHWLVGFNQKQLLSEEVFQNIIHIQTYNLTKYALCESPVSGGLQAEASVSRRSF